MKQEQEQDDAMLIDPIMFAISAAKIYHSNPSMQFPCTLYAGKVVRYAGKCVRWKYMNDIGRLRPCHAAPEGNDVTPDARERKI